MIAKVKLALVLLMSGIVFGFCQGYGILKIPQPKFVFDLIVLLTFIYLLIWKIRKRVEKRKRTPEKTRKVNEYG